MIHSQGVVSLWFKMSPRRKKVMLMFDLHKNECAGGKSFPVNNFALRLVLILVKGNAEMAYH